MNLLALVLLVLLLGFLIGGEVVLLRTSQAFLDKTAENHPQAGSLRHLAQRPALFLQGIVFARSLTLILIGVLLATLVGWLAALAALAGALAVSWFFMRRFRRPVSEHLLRLLAPFIKLVSAPWRLLPARFFGRATLPIPIASQKEFLDLVDEAVQQRLFDRADSDLIHAVFDFNDAQVENVMVPRGDMITLEAEAELDFALQVFLKTGVSRVPVIDNDAAGVLYLKDLIAVMAGGNPPPPTRLREIMRPAFFVPDSLPVWRLLRRMQRNNRHLALAVNEYGAVSGLVTLEDLIERLVGDISDEFDRESPESIALGGGRYWISGRLPLYELAELFDAEIDFPAANSVSGLLASLLDRLPQAGDTAEAFGLKFSVLETGRGKSKPVTAIVEVS